MITIYVRERINKCDIKYTCIDVSDHHSGKRYRRVFHLFDRYQISLNEENTIYSGKLLTRMLDIDKCFTE